VLGNKHLEDLELKLMLHQNELHSEDQDFNNNQRLMYNYKNKHWEDLEFKLNMLLNKLIKLLRKKELELKLKYKTKDLQDSKLIDKHKLPLKLH